MTTTYPLAITSVEMLKEASKDQAVICFISVKLPLREAFRDYKLVWYNKGKGVFYITSFNPYAIKVDEVETKETIKEDELETKTGLVQAIKRGNFYVE